MTIILARLTEDVPSAQRSVHVFLTGQNSLNGWRQAQCGFTAHHSGLESVPGLAGMPCELCLIETPLEPSAPTQEPDIVEPSAEIDMAGPLFAVGLRGEREWHMVPERPIVGDYDGRKVVLADCGRMAWLMPGEPYSGWPRCGECSSVEARNEIPWHVESASNAARTMPSADGPASETEQDN